MMGYVFWQVEQVNTPVRILPTASPDNFKAPLQDGQPSNGIVERFMDQLLLVFESGALTNLRRLKGSLERVVTSP
jgi:hypothetical protein